MYKRANIGHSKKLFILFLFNTMPFKLGSLAYMAVQHAFNTKFSGDLLSEHNVIFVYIRAFVIPYIDLCTAN